MGENIDMNKLDIAIIIILGLVVLMGIGTSASRSRIQVDCPIINGVDVCAEEMQSTNLNAPY